MREEVIKSICDWIIKATKRETTAVEFEKLPEVVHALAQLLMVDKDHWS